MENNKSKSHFLNFSCLVMTNLRVLALTVIPFWGMYVFKFVISKPQTAALDWFFLAVASVIAISVIIKLVYMQYEFEIALVFSEINHIINSSAESLEKISKSKKKEKLMRSLEFNEKIVRSTIEVQALITKYEVLLDEDVLLEGLELLKSCKEILLKLEYIDELSEQIDIIDNCIKYAQVVLQQKENE